MFLEHRGGKRRTGISGTTETGHVDVQVERPRRMDVPHRRERGERGHDRVTALPKFFHHIVHRLVGLVLAREGGQRRLLRHGRRVRRGVRLERRHRPRDGHRRDAPADTPAGHRVRLGDAINHDQILARRRHFERRLGTAFVGDASIDLVSEHPPSLVGRKIENGRELITRIHGAGGIAGRIEHQPLRARRRGGRQLGGRHFQVVRFVTEDRHRHRPRQFHHLVVARPRRRRNQHLVTGAKAAHTGVVQRLLRTRRHHHFRGGDRRSRRQQPIGISSDRFTQRQNALGRRVAGRPRFHGGGGSVPDERRRVEIGLAGAKIDNGLAGRLERPRLRGHGQRRGFLEAGDIGGRLEDQRHDRDAERRWMARETRAPLQFGAGPG